jgi:tetratricopeptide (TPR) repeat protein
VSVAAVTDAERVQVYHEFRGNFDARDYPKALPLARRLVALTEEQYGGADRAMVNPLSNLGTTQYRLHDYKAAEETFLRSVKIVEDLGATSDRILLQPLHGLGATYFATGQYEEASVVLKRALDLSRNLDGLFNIAQMGILDPLIDSLVRLERREEAERAFEYSVRVAESSYGKEDLRVLPPLDRYAHWQETVGHYTTARVLYARALQIAEDTAGHDSLQTVDPLRGIGRTYRLEFVNGPQVEPNPIDRAADEDSPVSTDDFNTGLNTPRLNPDGERALLMALQAIDKAQPVDRLRRGIAWIELGDWYLSGGGSTKAFEVYREAWKDLSAAGSTAALATPRLLAYRAPSASITRSKPADREDTEEHFVEARFTVTRAGRVTDLSTFATDATQSQQKTVLSAVKKARYAPGFDHGEPVDTPDVRLRERLLSKKPRTG